MARATDAVTSQEIVFLLKKGGMYRPITYLPLPGNHPGSSNNPQLIQMGIAFQENFGGFQLEAECSFGEWDCIETG
jgi:hypothetical protein